MTDKYHNYIKEYLIICQNYAGVINARDLFVRYLRYKSDIGEFLVDKKNNIVRFRGCTWRFVSKEKEEQALRGFKGTAVFSSNDLTRMVKRELNKIYGYSGGNNDV